MGDGSGGSNSADSYIGSLISLTSKSEIRYEGVLYTVDTENSNIALQNVRSFGTEGRKKDGPQILPSDKVYDYIIFRGSDIKDLQVKSSPAVQSSLQAPSDPAIISLQSQYSQSAAIPPTYVSPQVGPPVDVGPSTAYSGISPSPFRGAVHSLYQPATGIGSWGLPPPGANGTGIAVPMYWQGYYRPASGQTHVHHQPVPQPPPSLPAPPHLLQLASRSYPHVELTSDAIQAQGNGAFMNTSMSPSGAPFPVSTTGTATSIPPQTSVMLSSATASVSTPATPADFLKSSSNTETTLSTGSTVSTSLNGVSAVITPAAKVPRRVTLSLQPTQVAPQSTAAATLAGASTLSMSKPSVSTVNIASSPGSETGFDKASGFLIASGKNFVARTQLPERKGTDLTTSGSQVVGVPTMDKQQQQALQPLLPLPTSSLQPKHPLQGNGSVGMSNYVRKGRARGGRGRGNMLPHATQHFTEDFDFTAMNKKFNKDEVWGELGGKGECRDKVSDIDEEGVNHPEETSEPTLENVVPDLLKKPVYVKDDFFDSLSCDALDREEGRAERTKFSEQRKIDTETFGNFPLRSRAGRGRGGGRRGGYRGAYYSSQYASGGGRAVVYGRHRGPP